jgi:SAM-dependent methyltransferase
VTIFGELHARWYDRWHEAKDYPREVEQLCRILDKEGAGQDLIDIGCGTGRHAELLAAEGFHVVGVDRSEVMADLARARLAPHDGTVVRAELAALPFSQDFDVALMMFSVLGYQVDDEAMTNALAAVRRVLRPGGLFLFDVLDAATVLHDGAQGGVSIVRDDPDVLLRATTGHVYRDEQVYEFTMRLWQLREDKIVAHAEESHRLRFFLRRELEFLLRTNGFTMLGSTPLAGSQPGPARTWSRLAWARRT